MGEYFKVHMSSILVFKGGRDGVDLSEHCMLFNIEISTQVWLLLSGGHVDTGYATSL